MTVKIFKVLAIYKQHNLKETLIKHGLWGLKCTKQGIILNSQLEAARKVIIRLTKKMCKV